MARRKKKNTDLSADSAAAEAPASHGADQRVSERTEAAPTNAAVNRTDPAKGVPSQGVMWVISLAIVLHLATLFLSYSAIVEPSASHTNLLDSAAPYLRSTHFAADGRPFYLAHASPDEQPHRLQYASSQDQRPVEIDTQTQWTTIEPAGSPGLGASDRYGRWMGLISTLAQTDQPSLAASLLLPLVSADESIDAVRIIRLPTELTTGAQDAAPPVYLAKVVRERNQVNLVAIQSKRLTTYERTASDQPATVQPSGDADPNADPNADQSESPSP